jgi:hypothetical protein
VLRQITLRICSSKLARRLLTLTEWLSIIRPEKLVLRLITISLLLAVVLPLPEETAVAAEMASRDEFAKCADRAIKAFSGIKGITPAGVAYFVGLQCSADTKNTFNKKDPRRCWAYE